MKKFLSLLSLFAVLAAAAGVVFTACSSGGGGPSPASINIVTISPRDPQGGMLALVAGSSTAFIATVTKGDGSVVTAPDILWECSPETLGVFSSTASAATVFTPAPPLPPETMAYGYITAHYGGTKDTIKISVSNSSGTTEVIPDSIIIEGAPSQDNRLLNNQTISLTATVMSGGVPVPKQPTVEWIFNDNGNITTQSSLGGVPITYTAPINGSSQVNISVSYGVWGQTAVINYGPSLPPVVT